MKTPIVTTDAPAAIGAYSQAIKVPGFLFCSGQIALRPDGVLVTGTVSDETLQVMKNLEAVLQAGGATFSDVVQVTIYLTDITHFSEVNAVYATFFADSGACPSRSTVVVKALPKDARLEISMVALCE